MDFKGFQLTSTKQIHSRDELDFLLNTAKKMEPYAKGEKHTDVLQDTVIATLFFEPSTRTKLSFQTAAARLGAKLISETGLQFSSLFKGESIGDTMRMVEQYSDLIIMRHPEKGSADEACESLEIPFINAGDGPGQHPTQALLDLYTIQKEQGSIDGKTIALVGDLKFGRTVHSLSYLLKYFDAKLIFVSPKELKMPAYICAELEAENIEFKETTDLDSALAEADVVYMTRVQQERFEKREDYLRLKDAFILDANMLKNAKESITIMHPLPRLNEINTDVDTHPGAAYFRQAGNGVPVRMALISLFLGKEV